MLQRIEGSAPIPDWEKLKGDPLIVYYTVGIYKILDLVYYHSCFDSIVSYQGLPDPEIFYVEIPRSAGPHRDPAPQSVALNFIIDSAHATTRTWELKNTNSLYSEKFNTDEVNQKDLAESKSGEFWLLETRAIHSVDIPIYLKRSRKMISWRWSNIDFNTVLAHVKCTNHK